MNLQPTHNLSLADLDRQRLLDKAVASLRPDGVWRG
jgi:hypothetical protein